MVFVGKQITVGVNFSCNVGQCAVAFLLVCKCKVGQFKKKTRKKQKVVAGVGKFSVMFKIKTIMDTWSVSVENMLQMHCLLIICNVMLFVDTYPSPISYTSKLWEG